MPHVRPPETVASALRASAAGVPDAENAEQHGVAVKTIRRWRRDYQRRGLPRGQSHLAPPCPICDRAHLEGAAYSELLGWYLGDGYLSRGRREVFNLHVYNDARYTQVNLHILALMRQVKPGSRPHTRLLKGCVVSTVSWKHWPCLFPQHGPGRKHERPIVLEDWQRAIVVEHPGDFLRGLFHSDGCRVANWASRVVDGERRRHDYPRWQFTNTSEDILGLCGWALDLVEVAWRRSNAKTVSVSRRAAVAALDDLIGLKS
ncbi:transcriptional regulator [Nocardioides sp. KIGAM211]|uniref:Transcriptional regulator n=1 Tax=Nocardioides luti TaxID=2761101 RepID=A0A7X0RFD2_9ACTN|nr:helix-turn-helix domain-containing protein [Nocardioides luti]MBB6626300.1 transcriptional regulator [Nocardioides luti]